MKCFLVSLKLLLHCSVIFLMLLVFVLQTETLGRQPRSETEKTSNCTSNNNHEDDLESEGPSRYVGNPHPLPDYRKEHIGMLNLILSRIQDRLAKYDQFEGKLDSDILLETYYEAMAFKKKLQSSQYDDIGTISRQNAEFFFIKGLDTKVTRRRAFEASIEDFSRAAYEDSTSADPYYQIALYHLRCTGDSTEIIEHINKGLQYDPQNGELLRTLGMFYLNYDRYDSARAYLEQASKYLERQDPRIQFYMGLTFDPYFAMIRRFAHWSMDFTEKQNRRPAFPEIQKKKEELLLEITGWKDNMRKAFEFYDSSLTLSDGYIKPLNSTVWIMANEILRGDASYVQALLENLQHMEKFVGYGLEDPRFFNTLAFGYAALRDCETAQKYLDLSRERATTIQLSPRYQKDLELENKRLERMCELFITPQW